MVFLLFLFCLVLFFLLLFCSVPGGIDIGGQGPVPFWGWAFWTAPPTAQTSALNAAQLLLRSPQIGPKFLHLEVFLISLQCLLSVLQDKFFSLVLLFWPLRWFKICLHGKGSRWQVPLHQKKKSFCGIGQVNRPKHPSFPETCFNLLATSQGQGVGNLKKNACKRLICTLPGCEFSSLTSLALSLHFSTLSVTRKFLPNFLWQFGSISASRSKLCSQNCLLNHWCSNDSFHAPSSQD